MGWIDDGGKLTHAVHAEIGHAEIGDRRRAALIVGRRELLERALGLLFEFRGEIFLLFHRLHPAGLRIPLPPRPCTQAK